MTEPTSKLEEMNIPSSSPLSSISEPELSFTPPRITRTGRSTRSSTFQHAANKQMPERPKPKPATKRTPKKHKWDAENIIIDSRSPLARANLRSVLSNPMAWSVLDKEERAEILSLFPDKEHILDAGTEDAGPNFASLLNDDSFRYDCAVYTSNLAAGRHDPEWLASAWAAHERRKAGDFDEYLINKLQDDWEVELPDEMKSFRALPAQMTPEARSEGSGYGSLDRTTDTGEDEGEGRRLYQVKCRVR
ncbi:hypothetical protein PT974_07122 [Cladobotryum mycophilum]|uniref:DEUBAD domain-containing protein n=1 Tax=Cladobotryum mycophilum TaxID=491253 RepID=A0ABR0SNC4_9HYPO